MLEGKIIWITRPAGQAGELTATLVNEGATVEHLPMLAIQALPPNEAIKQKVLQLDQYSLLFFISTNAANLGLELIHDYWPQFPVQLHIYAVGPTTAAVIESYGLRAEFPKTRMSSEALLALDSLSHISGSKALIVRGVGGRELLAEALTEKGASVDYLEIYERVCPDYPEGKLSLLFKEASPDAVVVTSAEALENFRLLADRDGLSLSTLPLYVSSERIAAIAAQMGFVATVTMRGADDQAIISSLGEHLQSPQEPSDQ